MQTRNTATKLPVLRETAVLSGKFVGSVSYKGGKPLEFKGVFTQWQNAKFAVGNAMSKLKSKRKITAQ